MTTTPTPTPARRTRAARERTTPGEALVRALASAEFDAAAARLAPDVHVRAATPMGLHDLSDRDAALALLTAWFPAGDVEALESVESDAVGARQHVTYRVRWWSPERECLVFEQHAYYDHRDGAITAIELVCSGDQPAAAFGGRG